MCHRNVFKYHIFILSLPHPLLRNLSSVMMQRNHWYWVSLSLDLIICWSNQADAPVCIQVTGCSAWNVRLESKPHQPPLKDIFILQGNKLYNIKKELIWREINIWCTPNRFTLTARWTSTRAPRSSEKHSPHSGTHSRVFSGGFWGEKQQTNKIQVFIFYSCQSCTMFEM